MNSSTPPDRRSRASFDCEPLTSPSPDRSRLNVLTPTKLQYLPINHSFTNLHSQKYHSEAQLLKNTNSSPHNYVKASLQVKMSNHQGLDYTRELERKIHDLTVENKTLSKRLEGGSNRKNSLVIEKIKEQYQENISTLKMMVEQEIREAMGIIQDACRALSHQMSDLQDKVERLESKLQETQMKAAPGGQKRQIQILGGQQDSIGDILAVSIPEEEWEQSKNYSMTILKLEEEIQMMKDTILDAENAYKNELTSMKGQLQTMKRQLKDKEFCIKDLQDKLSRSQRSQQSSQSKFDKQIRGELLMLSANVNELAKQLEESSLLYNEAMQSLEEKNSEVESLTGEVLILRDKVIGQEQHRIMLEQKNKFLEGSLALLEKELKERKKILEEALRYRFDLERERQRPRQRKQGNSFLELTSRIDKLLMLQEERVQCLDGGGLQQSKQMLKFSN